MEESTVSKRELLDHHSNSTVATPTVLSVESDWESYLENSSVTVSINPWSLYQAIRNARILTVEPVVFLYFFGLYFTFPLFQQYYLNRCSQDVLQNTSYPYALNGTPSHCIGKADVNNYTGDNTTYGRVVESNATLLYVLRSLTSNSIAIIMILIMGPLSDRYGRRVVIILVAVGGLLQGLGSVVIVQFNLDLHYFVIIGAIEGCFGNFAAILMASFAYVSDISSGMWRTMRIGIVESMIFLSGLLALEFGAFWFQKLDCDILSPLYLYIACNFGAIAYTVLFLPESLTSEDRKRKNANKPSGVGAIIRGANIFFCRVKDYPVWKLWVALLPFGIVLAITLAGQTVVVFFFGDLNWSPRKTGSYQAVSTASHMVSLMVILPILVALKLPDPLTSLIGVAANVSMNLLIGLSNATYQIFIAASVQGLEGLAVTPLRGYMSKIIRMEDQGALFSVIASLECLSSLVSIAYTYLLPVLLHHNLSPGMVYVVLAGIGLIPIPFISALLIVWYKDKYSSKRLHGKIHEKISERTPILAAHHDWNWEDSNQSFQTPPPSQEQHSVND